MNVSLYLPMRLCLTVRRASTWRSAAHIWFPVMCRLVALSDNVSSDLLVFVKPISEVCHTVPDTPSWQIQEPRTVWSPKKEFAAGVPEISRMTETAFNVSTTQLA